MKAFQYRDLAAGCAVFALFGGASMWLLGRRKLPVLRWGLAGGLAATFPALLCCVFFWHQMRWQAGSCSCAPRRIPDVWPSCCGGAAQPSVPSRFDGCNWLSHVVSLPALVWLLGSQANSYADLNGYLGRV